MVKKNTSSYTKYEKARIIGARALQISMGAPILLKLSKAELDKLNYNPIEIAKLEFDKEVLPITVKRPLPTVK
jgi:DNA-directed RNA polymerase subunit K